MGLRVAILATLVALPAAFAAAVQVPVSKAGTHDQAIGVNDKKPADCDGITLTGQVAGSGSVIGGSASELVLGSSGVDTIEAGAGDDCVVGGGGDDAVDGGPGDDVCIGGPGTDSFTGCETAIQ